MVETKKIQKDVQHVSQKQDALAKAVSELKINDINNTNQASQKNGLITLIDFADNYGLTLPLTDRDQLLAFEEKLKIPHCLEEFVSYYNFVYFPDINSLTLILKNHF